MFEPMTWKQVGSLLPDLSEAEVEMYLKVERVNPRRKNMLIRLHQKLNTLRTTREREEILTERPMT